MRALLALLLVAAVALAGPCAAAQATGDAALRKMLATRVDGQRRATGVVVGIVTPRGHRIVAYGVTRLGSRTPVDGATVFDVGSVTKVFTALLLADMAGRGEVRLDEPVSACLPPGVVNLPTYEGRQITFADLATQTSGLPLRPANLTGADPRNPYAGYTAPQLYDFLAGYRLPQAPGAKYEYSNVGFGLLGLALAACAHTDYAVLVRARITGPLGMDDTALTPTALMSRREAVGYDADLKPTPHWDLGALASAGQLRSTADDLMTLLDAALGFKPGPLTADFATMTATQRPGGMQPATAIALAWNIYRDKDHEVVWKNGSVGGFRAFIGYDRAAQLGVVALANAQSGEGADDIGLHLLDPAAVGVDLDIPRPHRAIALPADVLDRYEGVYRFSATDLLTVRRDGDHLIASTPDYSLPFLAWAPGRFFLSEPPVELTFSKLENGHTARLVFRQNSADQVAVRIGDPPP